MQGARELRRRGKDALLGLGTGLGWRSFEAGSSCNRDELGHMPLPQGRPSREIHVKTPAFEGGKRQESGLGRQEVADCREPALPPRLLEAGVTSVLGGGGKRRGWLEGAGRTDCHASAIKRQRVQPAASASWAARTRPGAAAFVGETDRRVILQPGVMGPGPAPESAHHACRDRRPSVRMPAASSYGFAEARPHRPTVRMKTRRARRPGGRGAGDSGSRPRNPPGRRRN